jgi:dynein heavy chain 1
VENAIIMQRFNRYPLVIDPAGQASTYLTNQFKDRKISSTSFLDASFMKVLASALRFGTPLLVQDVENIDPILNPVLNKEFHKTGGRVLIRLGDEDIDFSPSFLMFMTTRDPSCQFSPDLCSRVTFVNFTVTPSSLQNQCLSQVLQKERPDIDEKRSGLLKLQGEYQARLRDLEDSLLNELASIQGNILDNDTVINALETLKTEAADVAKEMAQTEEVMAEVEHVSGLYQPLALSCATIYFTLEQLSALHFLYHFSLQFFLDIVDFVLNTPNAAPTDADAAIPEAELQDVRLKALTTKFFSVVVARVSRSLLQEDKLLFAIRLAQIRLSGTPDDPSTEELDMLLRRTNVPAAGGPAVSAEVAALTSISAKQQRELQHVGGMKKYEGLIPHLGANAAAWTAWAKAKDDVTPMPEGWEGPEKFEKGASKDTTISFMRLLVSRVVRPDMLLSFAVVFVTNVFGEGFAWRGDVVLKKVVEEESKCTAPLLLCSQPGFDASGKVDDLAYEMKTQFKSVAMGSEEGFDIAEKIINSSIKQGGWVLLRNVHLCPGWVGELEKKLHSREPHKDFRLFLTSEINPKLPTNLLRLADNMIFEPPTGVRASMLRSFATMPEERMAKQPAERGRLYVLLAWFHALVQERLRYTPVGWSKAHEFSDADMKCALDAIDSWIDLGGAGKAHLAPELIPWEALRVSFEQSVYGGRVDNPFDQKLLSGLLERLFTPKSFDADFALSESWQPGQAKPQVEVALPDGNGRAQFLEWVEKLPAQNSPLWLGLPSTAETMLLYNQGEAMHTHTLTQHTQQHAHSRSPLALLQPTGW